MTTLQGIIANCTNNANVQSEVLANITTNVSNSNTTGYKSVRFEDYLQPGQGVAGVVRYDYGQGALMLTQNPFDVAIDGAGFIQVTKKDGSAAYTRDGAFALNSEGYLVTTDGCLVGDGIKIPANYDRLKIEKDGTVKVILERNDDPEILGIIPLVTFNNPEGLKSIEDNKLIATVESGDPFLKKDHSSIKQSHLEKSNTDIFGTVDAVMKLSASQISSFRLIKVVDEVYRQAINLRQ